MLGEEVPTVRSTPVKRGRHRHACVSTAASPGQKLPEICAVVSQEEARQWTGVVLRKRQKRVGSVRRRARARREEVAPTARATQVKRALHQHVFVSATARQPRGSLEPDAAALLRARELRGEKQSCSRGTSGSQPKLASARRGGPRRAQATRHRGARGLQQQRASGSELFKVGGLVTSTQANAQQVDEIGRAHV